MELVPNSDPNTATPAWQDMFQSTTTSQPTSTPPPHAPPTIPHGAAKPQNDDDDPDEKISFSGDPQGKELIDEVTVRTSEVEQLEQELELMNEAAEMAFNNQHSVDFYLHQLNEQIKAKRSHLLTLESEWDALRKPLEERKRSLEESLYSNNLEALEMLQKLREVQQEEQFILSEIIKREEEHLKLSADLEKQPKIASRKCYTDRIKEITKNSWKQDADVERILKDTREVQLESNSIQERLHRTYAIADELVFREAKKDPTGLQVYRLLVSIHKGFEQISDKILSTDRIRREIAESETKLAATNSNSLDPQFPESQVLAISKVILIPLI